MNNRREQSIVFDAHLFLQPRLIRRREYNMSKYWSSAIASFSHSPFRALHYS